MRGRVLRVLGAVVLVATAGACGGKSHGSDRTGPTLRVEEAPTTSAATPTTVANYDVPEVVDQAYVQRVVSAYDKVLGDAGRIFVRDRGLSPEFLGLLSILYTEPEYQFQVRLWTADVESGGLDKRLPVPGDPITVVHFLVEASQKCVIVRADRDLHPTVLGEPPESPEDDYLVLVRKKPERDPTSINPTPWSMAFDGSKNDNTVPRNSCDD